MKKIWLLIIGLFVAYIAIFADLSKINHLPVNNWIYRLIMLAGCLALFYLYYKANWGKSGKKPDEAV